MTSGTLIFPGKPTSEEVMLKDAITRIVECIVITPSEVRVTLWRDRSADVVLNIQVAPQDLGRIIGRGGSVARAMRQYVTAFEREHGGRYRLKLARRVMRVKAVCPADSNWFTDPRLP